VSKPFLLLGTHGLQPPGFFAVHRDYAVTLWKQMSFLLPAAAAGAVLTFRSKSWRQDTISQCMLAVIIAIPLSIFAAKLPIQDRLLIVAFAAVIFFVGRLAAAVAAPAKRAALMFGGLVIFGGLNWMSFTPLPPNHIRPAVAFLYGRHGSGAILVPSNNEGPWIAEFAKYEGMRPGRVIVRPTKLFGEENWNGTDWRPYYTSLDEVNSLFERIPIRYCILPAVAGGRRYPHDDLLEAALADSSRWRRVPYGPENQGPTAYRIYENLQWTPAVEPAVYREIRRTLEKHLP
jgi:hypothetical protein